MTKLTERPTASTAARRTLAEAKKSRKTTAGRRSIPAEERYKMIAEAAYLRAKQRDFAGDPIEHWLAAETEIDERLKSQPK